MRYIRAEDILPSDLLATVQQYIDGAALYIPKKNDGKRTWGSVNGTKAYYAERNAEIYHSYKNGDSTVILSQRFCLSEKSIQRIIKRCQERCPAEP